MAREKLSSSFEDDAEPVTVEQLEQLLRRAEVPVDSWGQGSAKTLQHLHTEIEAGEAALLVLPHGELVRQVRVVGVDVFGVNAQGERFKLTEDRQEFKDGRIRRRDLGSSLAEKLKPGEEAVGAAERALAEELGITGAQIWFLQAEQPASVHSSYPGLQSTYAVHRFAALIPPTSFVPEGYIEEQSDKTNYYVWLPVEPGFDEESV